MPTVRGILVGLGGFGLMLLGRFFGADGLLQVGFGLLVLILAALVVVRFSRHRLQVTRRITPERAHAEQAVTVTLVVRNTGGGRAPVLMLEDVLPVDVSGRARFTLLGLEPAGSRTIGYEIRAPRRGRYEIGPLRVTFTDPFGLARSRDRVAGTDQLLVHPRVEQLASPRDLGQYRSPAVSALRQLTGARGDDFYTLREYAEGDDLRKIHWPSTAKRDRFMIRQEETPWHTRATILLDDRAEAHAGMGPRSSFERAVEAAASLAGLYSRSGYSFRLVLATDRGLPSSRGDEHFMACLDLLATLTPARDAASEAFTARIGELQARGPAEGTLVAVSGLMDLEGAVALGECRRRFRDVFAILIPRARFAASGVGDAGTATAVSQLARSGVRPIVIGPGESLRRAWAAMSFGRYGVTERAWEQRQERA